MVKFILSSLGYKDSHIPSFADDDVIEISFSKLQSGSLSLGICYQNL